MCQHVGHVDHEIEWVPTHIMVYKTMPDGDDHVEHVILKPFQYALSEMDVREGTCPEYTYHEGAWYESEGYFPMYNVMFIPC